MKNEKQKWLTDFKEFLEANETPTSKVADSVRARIAEELKPALSTVFLKFAVVHAVVGSLTLLVCPQLGIGPFFGHHGLMGYFMEFGPAGCAAGCGGFFLGMSFLGVSLFLRPEELKRVKQYQLLHITLFAALSYATLMFLGATEENSTFMFWIVGAILGARLFFELGTRVRFRRSIALLRGVV